MGRERSLGLCERILHTCAAASQTVVTAEPSIIRVVHAAVELRFGELRICRPGNHHSGSVIVKVPAKMTRPCAESKNRIAATS